MVTSDGDGSEGNSSVPFLVCILTVTSPTKMSPIVEERAVRKHSSRHTAIEEPGELQSHQHTPLNSV